MTRFPVTPCVAAALLAPLVASRDHAVRLDPEGVHPSQSQVDVSPGDDAIRGFWFVPGTSKLLYLAEGTRDGAAFTDLRLVNVPEPVAAGWLALPLALTARRRRR